MTIRQATADDLDAVKAIVRDVVQEMGASGNFQWDDAYPDEARFRLDLDNGALYVADDEGGVAGFAAVDEDEPDGYGGVPWRGEGGALVLHRLAVAPQRRGQGVASRLEAFVCALALSRGIRHLKSDTYSTNLAMQAFFVGAGYRKVGEMAYRGKPLPFFCFEKVL
jgi:ribosomal protein S18 acetylase RimI-like enzyme